MSFRTRRTGTWGIDDSAPSPEVSSLEAIIDEVGARIEAGEAIDLEELVQRHPEHASQLREIVPAIAALEASATDPPLARAAPPEGIDSEQRLGDFRLIRQVGRGGMGVVYEAQQLSLRRRVALKVLPMAGLLDERQVLRFHNEAAAAAALQHPNIVAVYSVGCERGVHYLAMQFVEGCTLADAIAAARKDANRDFIAIARSSEVTHRHTEVSLQSAASDQAQGVEAGSDILPAETQPIAAASTERGKEQKARYRTAARLIKQVAEALDYAHSLGVIHRDVKPSNLILDRNGNIAVADFGLAHLEGNMSLTMTGDVMGTLRYMSPEQATGRRDLVDQRSDVYSLGLTLYELLALCPAFPQRDRASLLRAVVDQEPQNLRQLVPNIPKDLETIASKAMAKEPEARYQSAKAFAEDLGRFLTDQPILARPPNLLGRVFKWMRRHHAAALALAAVLVVVSLTSLTSVLLVTRAYRLEAEHRAHAVSAAQQARKNFAMAVGAVEALTQASEETLADMPQMESLRRELLVKALAFHEAFLVENAEDLVKLEAARASHRAGRIRELLGDAADAEATYTQAIGLCERLHIESRDDKEVRTELVKSLLGRGKLYQSLGQYASANADLRQAELKSGNVLPVAAASAISSRAAVAEKLGNNKEAELLHQKAIELLEQQVATMPSGNEAELALADALGGKSALLAKLGNYESATVLQQRQIQLLEKMLQSTPNSPAFRSMLARARLSYSTLLHKAGDSAEVNHELEEAAKYYRALVQQYPAVPGYKVSLGSALRSLSDLHAKAGRQRESLKAAAEALSIHSKLVATFPGVPEYTTEVAKSHVRNGIQLWALGHKAEAEQHFRAAVDAGTSLADSFPELPEPTATLVLSQGKLAEYYRLTARNVESAQEFQKAVEAAEKLAARFPEVPQYRFELCGLRNTWARALHRIGRHQEAARIHQSSIDLAQELCRLYPNELPFRQTLGNAFYFRAESHLSAQQHEHAVNDLREAIQIFCALSELSPERIDYRTDVIIAYEKLGLSLCNLKRLREAEITFREAYCQAQRVVVDSGLDEASTSDGVFNAFNNLAWFLAYSRAGELQSPTEAAAVAKEGLRLRPKDKNLWTTLVDAGVQVAETSTAQEAYQLALEWWPNDPDVLTESAAYYAGLRDPRVRAPERAREIAFQLAKLGEKTKGLIFRAATLHILLNEEAEAATLAHSLLSASDYSDDDGLAIQAFGLLRSLAVPAEAIQLAEERWVTDPRPPVGFALGLIRYRNGDMAGAGEALRAVLDSDRQWTHGEAQVWLVLAMVQKAKGADSEASHWLGRADEWIHQHQEEWFRQAPAQNWLSCLILRQEARDTLGM